MDKNIPKEKKGFNKLPEDVQKKMDKALGRNKNLLEG